MSRILSLMQFKSLLAAFALASMICVGCGGAGGEAKPVVEQDEIEKFLAENPDADVDMEEEDDEAFSE